MAMACTLTLRVQHRDTALVPKQWPSGVPMLMVACREMTSGESGFSSLMLSLDKSCCLSLLPPLLPKMPSAMVAFGAEPTDRSAPCPRVLRMVTRLAVPSCPAAPFVYFSKYSSRVPCLYWLAVAAGCGVACAFCDDVVDGGGGGEGTTKREKGAKTRLAPRRRRQNPGRQRQNGASPHMVPSQIPNGRNGSTVEPRQKRENPLVITG